MVRRPEGGPRTSWRSRRHTRRELDAAWRGVDDLFPMPADAAPGEAWDVYGDVDEILAAVAAGGGSGFRVGGHVDELPRIDLTQIAVPDAPDQQSASVHRDARGGVGVGMTTTATVAGDYGSAHAHRRPRPRAPVRQQRA